MNILYLGDKNGKTTKLIDHYLALINKKNVPPEKILFLTIDDLSLKQKIFPQLKNHVQTGFEELWIDNFSSFCRKILRKYFLQADLPPNFEVLSGLEEHLIVEKASKISFLSHFENAKNYPGFVNSIVNIIDAIKLNKKSFLNANINSNEKYSDVKKVFLAYEDEIRKRKLLDYRDLNILTIDLFEKNPEILKQYIDNFDYILIDNFEEATQLDYKVVERIIYENNSIISMNEEGSIYKFRGANPRENISLLLTGGKHTKISLEHIQFENQKQLNVFAKAENEIDFIARKIRDLILNGGVAPSDIAVVQRDFASNANLISEIFTKYKIPYSFHGQQKLFSNPIIITVIYFLKLLNNYENIQYKQFNKYLLRIFQASNNKFNIEMIKLKNNADHNKKRIIEFFEELDEEAKLEYPDSFKKKYFEIINLIFDLNKNIKNSKQLTDLVFEIFEKLGFWEKSLKNENVLQTLKSFYKLVNDFIVIQNKIYNREIDIDSFIILLDKMISAYSIDQSFEERDLNKVQVSTLQKLKGKYYKVVFFAACCEGIMPRVYKENDILSNDELNELGVYTIRNIDDFIEQERRLFNIGIGHACGQLFVSYAKEYMNEKNMAISSFIFEQKIFSDNEIEHANEKIDKQFVIAKNQIQTYEEYIKKLVKHNHASFINEQHSAINSYAAEDYFKDYKFSASSLKVFKDCPQKFMLNYLMKIKPSKSSSLIFGSIVHEILEDFHSKYKKSEMMFDNELKDESCKLVDEKFEKYGNDFRSLGERSWLKKRAKKILDEYFEDI
ncbi:PD-(D/E)XK nuclease family protein, partial [bacterium]